tara:strand:- start:2551 stop:2802 length:252 start_codon:yes stop_codon:yes gene_type:complete
MDSIFLKSIIIKHINNFVTILSNEFKIEKDLIIKKIYNNYEIIINNIKIDMIDIYNEIGIDEIPITITNNTNVKLDLIFNSSK